jgi:hypothetical protein
MISYLKLVKEIILTTQNRLKKTISTYTKIKNMMKLFVCVKKLTCT